ncbi:MAG TPA: single-stranded-DNA-specific exonuclease RecJ [Gemmatimonadaceae bacterium]|nr:single-stranded-DNA-specific exonuclease RecJ [Gemmatimonadaceae bacterium]
MTGTATPAVRRPRFRGVARWILPKRPDPAAVAALGSSLNLPEPVARLLVMRGFADDDSAKKFLRPRLDHLHDALLLKGADKAVERLAEACEKSETVMIHGDYDVDGICSTTIMTRVLRQFGAKAVPFIPRRIEDGYDLSSAGVNAAIEAGANVVLTCDCGTSAVEPVAALCRAGIDVIVSDHHLPGSALPDCLAVLNPNQPGCEYPDKHLAAVGVAFKLALALAKRLGKNDAFIWRMLDLVALATVADVARLSGENRVMVRYGLRMLAESENVGLRAMVRAAGLDNKVLTTGRVGFILAPRLNAVGRIGHAIRGVQLLMTEDVHEANTIARELEELNAQRQELDRKTLEEAREMVASLDMPSTFGIVLAREGWHPGVIGIVASRIVEEFGRPTIMIALDGETGKGSGRSNSVMDLHKALGETRDLLVRYGGHRAAAGITISRDRVADFAARFNAVAALMLKPEDLLPEVKIDMEIAIDNANDELEKMLRHFEPFGIGNPTPVLVARGVSLAGKPRLIGQDGLKLRLDTGAGELEAIGWGLADRFAEFEAAKRVDIAFRLERDEYRGESRLQARIADIVPTS